MIGEIWVQSGRGGLGTSTGVCCQTLYLFIADVKGQRPLMNCIDPVAWPALVVSIHSFVFLHFASRKARIILHECRPRTTLHNRIISTLPKATRISSTSRSAITPERKCIMALPRLSPSCSCFGEFVSLAQTTRFLASCSKATSFPVLVHWLDNPVDSWITSDDSVLWIDEDDFEVFVRRILIDPVGIENSKIGTSPANALFSSGFEGSLVFELVHTLVCWFAICCTLRDWLLTTTSADTNAVDDIALLSFVTQATSLVRARRSSSAVDDIELTELY